MKRAETVNYLGTFEYDETFRVDVTLVKETNGNGETWETYEAYLFAKGYGIKDFMFGIPKGEAGINSVEDFLCIVEANLDEENYIEFYQDEYMD